MTGVIVNPASGRGRAGREWPAIEAALRRAFGELEVRMTAARGDGTRLAGELLDLGVEPIIAVGGDGTCSEVAGAGNLVLGVLCVGSACDFARSLGAPRDWREGVEWLRNARPTAMDLGCASYTTDNGARETRPFLNVASFGLGGRVVRHTGKPYLLAAIHELGGPSAQIELLLDGERHAGRFLHVAVGNGAYQGNAMHVCPRAQLDDGLLEVTAIESVGLLDLALSLRKVYSGAILTHPKVRAWRARSIHAAADERVALEFDGEPSGWLPVELHVLPSAIRVLR